jgi:hypothetical protein
MATSTLFDEGYDTKNSVSSDGSFYTARSHVSDEAFPNNIASPIESSSSATLRADSPEASNSVLSDTRSATMDYEPMLMDDDQALGPSVKIHEVSAHGPLRAQHCEAILPARRDGFARLVN